MMPLKYSVLLVGSQVLKSGKHSMSIIKAGLSAINLHRISSFFVTLTI